jgi:endonuclease-3
MTKKSNATQIYKILSKTYPNVKCELTFKTPFQLLVATVLSAQCTDKRVNMVTPNLFKKFGTPEKMAKARQTEIEKFIRSAGFYRTKAKNIKLLSNKLLTDFEGKVPKNLESLIKLPGVGRKTANVVLGHAYGIPGITVDTHFGRLSRRFGWTNNQDPVKVEIEVSKLIAEKEWTNLSQRLIWHGRRVCFARNPACGACVLKSICPSFGIGIKDEKIAKTKVKTEADFK